MVFEGLLVAVLNRFLGPYVKNLDASQLRVAIWSGDVHLDNLELKENVLSQFDIPIKIISGYIDKLRLKIPWKSLYSDPVIIEVDGIYIIASPDTVDKYDHKKAVEEEKEKKQAKLKEIEDLRAAAKAKSNVESSDPGFVERLITQIIRNVQLTVRNIHIRYEDNVTVPSKSFSFGVTLDSLILQSTDENWIITNNNTSDLIYKLVKLDCLAVYWNSHDNLISSDQLHNWKQTLKDDICRPQRRSKSQLCYIVKPISAQAKLIGSTTFDKSIPQLSAQLNLFGVSLTLDKEQYQDIVRLVSYLDRLSIGRKYRQYRPIGTLSAQQKWLFAYTAIFNEEVKRKLTMWSWKRIKSHRNYCRQYVKLYIEKLRSSSPPPHVVAKLLDLEDILDVFNITVCRQQAHSKVAREGPKKDESWFGSWFGSSSVQPEVVPSKEQLEIERLKLYQAIGYTEGGKTANYPKEYIAHTVKCSLTSLSLQLTEGANQIAKVTVSQCNAVLNHRPSSKNISVCAEVEKLTLLGACTNESQVVLISSNVANDNKLLCVHYEMKPLDNTDIDHAIKMSIQPLHITYDGSTIQNIMDMFKLPDQLQLQKTSSLAIATIDQLKTQTRAGLQHAIDERKLMDINILIQSPVIMLPEFGVYSEANNILVIDLGSLCITSDMKYNVPDVRRASAEELEKAFYDYFNVNLKDVSISLIGRDEYWRDVDKYILTPLQLDLQLQKSLLPNDTRLPGLKVISELTDGITLKLSEERLKNLLVLLQSIPILEFSSESTDSQISYDQMSSQVISDDLSNIVQYIDQFPVQKEEDDVQSESDDEFMTASEGEDDKEKNVTTTLPQSSVKVLLSFLVPQINVQFSNEYDNMDLTLSSLSLGFHVRTWDNELNVSLMSIGITHNLSNSSVNILTSQDKFLQFKMIQVNSTAPHYKTYYKSIQMKLELNMSHISVELNQQSIVSAMTTIQNITSVVETAESKQVAKSIPENSGNKFDSSLVVILQLSGLELLVSDKNGDILKGNLSNIIGNVENNENRTSVSASIQRLSLTDLQSTSRHPKVITTDIEPVLSVAITLYNNIDAELYHSLDTKDIEIVSSIEKIHVVIEISFVFSLLEFVKSININKELMESAKHIASDTALETAKKVKENSSKRIKLDVKVNAPVITVPVSTNNALIIDLGTLSVNNKFQWAHDLFKQIQYNEEYKPVADVLSLSISHVQFSRTNDASCDSHVILSPVIFTGQVVRCLDKVSDDIPTISVQFDLADIKMSINPGDYRIVTTLVDSITAGNKSTEQHVVKNVESNTSKADTFLSLLHLELAINSIELSIDSEIEKTQITVLLISGSKFQVDVSSNHVTTNMQINKFEITNPQSRLYTKIVDCVQNSTALDCQIIVYTSMDSDDYTSPNMVVRLAVGSVRIIALMSYINLLMNFVEELKIKQDVIDKAKQAAHDTAVVAAKKVQEVHKVGQRVSLELSIDAPEIVIPALSTSEDVVIVYFGKLNFWNNFFVNDTCCTKESIVVYEQSHVSLSCMEVYKSIWCTDSRHSIMEQCTVNGVIQRNLSTSWYHDMPTISVDITLPSIKVNISPAISQIFSDIVFGNFNEMKQSQIRTANRDGQIESNVSNSKNPSDQYLQQKQQHYIEFVAKFLLREFVVNFMTDQKSSVAEITVIEVNGNSEISSANEISVQVAVNDVTVSDTTDNFTSSFENKQLLAKHDKSKQLLEVDFKRDEQRQQIGSVTISAPQIIVNISYIMYLIGYLVALSKPFTVQRIPPVATEAKKNTVPVAKEDTVPVVKEDTVPVAKEDTVPVAKEDTVPVAQKDTVPEAVTTNVKFTVSVNDTSMLLLVDNDSLIIQTNVISQVALRNGRLSVFASLDQLSSISKSSEKCNEILSPCSVSLTLSSDKSGKKANVELQKAELTLSPFTVCIILKIINALNFSKENNVEDIVPLNFWDLKDIDYTRWYFQNSKNRFNILSDENVSDDQTEEILIIEVEQISVMILQEHPVSGQLSKAFSIVLGCYGNKALNFQAQNWTGKLWIEIIMSLSMSYFNYLTDVWEPLLEPLVNDSQDIPVYSSWSLQGILKKLIHDDGNAELALSVEALSALQLTLSLTSISLLQRLIERYLAPFSEEYVPIKGGLIDAEESNVIVSNEIGQDFVVQLKPKENLKYLSKKIELLKYEEKVTFVKEEKLALPGEIDVHYLQHQSILTIQLNGYRPHDIVVSSSGKYYYHMKPSDKTLANINILPLVVSISKVSASDPTEVSLRSPLQIYNHLATNVYIYWSSSERLKNNKVLMKIPSETCSSVPLSVALSGGYYFVEPLDTSSHNISSTGVSSSTPTIEQSLVLQCPSMYIQVYNESEQYNNVFTVSDGPHNILHLRYPLTLHNLLPYDISVNGTAIKSGCEVNFSTVNTMGHHQSKLTIKMKYNSEILTGEITLSHTKEEFVKLKSHHSGSHTVIFGLKHENYSHIKIFSLYWLVNKTGRVLEYSHKGFLGSRTHSVHSTESPLVLFSDNNVSLRLQADDKTWSEWSNGFSLDVVGSDGYVTCSTEHKDYHIGISCRLASFSLTKVITITPFYMLCNNTKNDFVVLECKQPKDSKLILKSNECTPFWPVSTANKLIVNVMDGSKEFSAPFDYTINGANFIKINSSKIQAIPVRISVTGSANVISFDDYYQGAAPIQLVNTLPYDIVYGQCDIDNRTEPMTHEVLKSSKSCMYTWSDPIGQHELLWKLDSDTKFTKYTARDGFGTISFQTERKSSESKFNPLTTIAKTSMKMKELIKSNKSSSKIANADGYWVSFTDDLQRVLLFTSDRAVVDRILSIDKLHDHSLSVSLSLKAVGLSLVNDRKGLEIAYIGLPQSDHIWEIEKSPDLWKPVDYQLSRGLDEAYNTEERGKKVKIFDDMVVSFASDTEIYLEDESNKRNKIRRSHFNGFFVKLVKAQQLTLIQLKINKVQIDNQLPGSDNSVIFYCYPPPPSIAAKLTPKPFVDMSLIIKNSKEIQFLQVLIQEMGFILDLDFVIEIAQLFGSFGKKRSDVELMNNEKLQLQYNLKQLKVESVTSNTSKVFLKFVHLSPIDLHISFSLDISEKRRNELSFFADQNVLLKFVLDTLYVFVTFFGRAQDAELKLGYFEIQERALTTRSLQNRILEHYKQQFLHQVYSVILGLEVLGNPIGFVRGLTEGTVGLFYQPFQGAVLGPEEFLEGLALGSHQFLSGTVGGVIGIGAKVTGVVGNALARLTFDKEFQEDRPQQQSFGQGLETLGKGFYQGVTGVVTQPVKGAMKEGLFGFIKGTSKGVLGLVFRPTGGIIDFTSATLLAVQKKTQVGNFELVQLRTPRYIARDKVVRPYSLHMSTGYALFLTYDNCKLFGVEMFINYVEIGYEPLKAFLATDKRIMILKENKFLKKLEKESEILLKVVYSMPYLNGNVLCVPVTEHSSSVTSLLGLGSKKESHTIQKIPFDNGVIATRALDMTKLTYTQYNSN